VILHLRAAVEQLYAALPARFTPLRSELVAEARKAGDKDLATSIGALRKPTVAAWAVNHFVREHADELEEFREFAELLREAQRSLDADQLRLLGRERSRRVDALAERIAQESAQEGQKLGAGVAQEVRDTLTALIADEGAEASVLTGSLVRSLSYSGFGSVDVEDVVALGDDDMPGRPSLSVVRGKAGDAGDEASGEDGGDAVDLEERRRAKRAAERARLQSTLETARSELRTADRQVAVLTARHEEVTEGIADLERRLATARGRLEKVTRELDEATGVRDRREQEEAKAQEALAGHDADG
jgi:DNA repair exonuclease SbcCD ATPase subunit